MMGGVLGTGVMSAQALTAAYSQHKINPIQVLKLLMFLFLLCVSDKKKKKIKHLCPVSVKFLVSCLKKKPENLFLTETRLEVFGFRYATKVLSASSGVPRAQDVVSGPLREV